MSERLLHHDPAPAIAVLRRQAGVAELPDDGGKEIRGGRKVIEDIPAGAVVLVHGSDPCPELAVSRRARGVERQVVKAQHHPIHDRGIAVTVVAAEQVLLRLTPELVVGHARPCGPDHREVIGEQAGLPQVVEGRQQLAPGEVTGRAEDHHRAGRRLRRGA